MNTETMTGQTAKTPADLALPDPVAFPADLATPWLHGKPLLFRAAVQLDFTEDRILPAVANSMEFTQSLATLTLADGRVLDVSGGINGLSLAVSWPRDDPKNPGLDVKVRLKPVLDMLVHLVESGVHIPRDRDAYTPQVQAADAARKAREAKAGG